MTLTFFVLFILSAFAFLGGDEAMGKFTTIGGVLFTAIMLFCI